jgi:hypothetical protein
MSEGRKQVLSTILNWPLTSRRFDATALRIVKAGTLVVSCLGLLIVLWRVAPIWALELSAVLMLWLIIKSLPRDSTIDHRRWFRFGMQTLFVVVTEMAILAWFVSYQCNWLQQRRDFIRSRSDLIAISEASSISTHAPKLLWIYGEIGYDYIYLAAHSRSAPASEAEIAEARRLFPEAQVVAGPRASYLDATIDGAIPVRPVRIFSGSPLFTPSTALH